MRYTRVLGWSSLAAVAVCLAMPAHAAEAADQGGSAAETSGKDVIIVTATRQAADKQKVGVALTAITSEDIARLAPHTLQDLQGTAPNVFIGSGTAAPGQSAIFIRGQGYADVEKTQSPPVGVIQDGVFFGNNTGQLLDMFNVCAVEVDRGPQGIFYGKNTTAGLINVTRCAPTRKLGQTLKWATARSTNSTAAPWSTHRWGIAAALPFRASTGGRTGSSTMSSPASAPAVRTTARSTSN